MKFEELQNIFRALFENDGLLLRPELTAAEVPGWDSISHINLVVAIEDAFGVTFSTDEIRRMGCVGDLVSILQRHSVDIAWPQSAHADSPSL